MDLNRGIDDAPTHGFFVKIEDMGDESQACQAEYGDYLLKLPNDDFQKYIELELWNVDLISLIQRNRSFSTYKKENFVNNYKQILDLLPMSINSHMSKLVLHQWNSYY